MLEKEARADAYVLMVAVERGCLTPRARMWNPLTEKTMTDNNCSSPPGVAEGSQGFRHLQDCTVVPQRSAPLRGKSTCIPLIVNASSFLIKHPPFSPFSPLIPRGFSST